MFSEYTDWCSSWKDEYGLPLSKKILRYRNNGREFNDYVSIPIPYSKKLKSYFLNFLNFKESLLGENHEALILTLDILYEGKKNFSFRIQRIEKIEEEEYEEEEYEDEEIENIEEIKLRKQELEERYKPQEIILSANQTNDSPHFPYIKLYVSPDKIVNSKTENNNTNANSKTIAATNNQSYEEFIKLKKYYSQLQERIPFISEPDLDMLSFLQTAWHNFIPLIGLSELKQDGEYLVNEFKQINLFSQIRKLCNNPQNILNKLTTLALHELVC